MYRKLNRLAAACASAALFVSTVSSNPVVTLATALESDTAVAGVAVSMNNYYASSQSPEADILNYLKPMVTAGSETEPSSAASVNAKIKNDKGSISGTAAADKLIAEDAESEGSGIVSTVGYVNMRKSPSTSAPVVGYLYSNCLVDIYGTVENDEGVWYLIRTNGIDGYVFADFVLTGEDARIAEDNIQNKYATVQADELEVYDTAASGAKVIGTVYKDESYQVLEYQGAYVKIASDGVVIGYVRRDGVKITTQFAQAVAVDDWFVEQRLEAILTEIDDGKRIYDERMAAYDYSAALSAIEYTIENWNTYIGITEDFGLDDLKAEAEQQRSAAMILRDKAQAFVDAEAKDAEKNVVQPSQPETQPSQPETEPSQPETQPSQPETQPSQPETEPSQPETQPSQPETQPSQPETQPSQSETQPSQPETQPSQSETQPSSETHQIVYYEARYNGGNKTAGEVLYQAEIYMHLVYSDGTETDIAEGLQCPQVGMMLTEGRNVITVHYGDLSSSFELWAAAAPTEPETQPSQPETQPSEPETQPSQPETQPSQPETQPSQPETQPSEPETQPTQAETEPTQPSDSAISAQRQQVVSNAAYWVGKCNYVYGANNLTIGGAVDCSAFTMNIFASVGVSLPRTSASQRYAGTWVSYEQLRPGDLVCYEGHVAIYIGNGTIIHAKNAASGIVYDSVFFSASMPPVAYVSVLP